MNKDYNPLQLQEQKMVGFFDRKRVTWAHWDRLQEDIAKAASNNAQVTNPTAEWFSKQLDALGREAVIKFKDTIGILASFELPKREVVTFMLIWTDPVNALDGSRPDVWTCDYDREECLTMLALDNLTVATPLNELSIIKE